MHVSIRVQGHLDTSWQEWLEHLVIIHDPDGTSQLFGTLPDQSALYGILHKLDQMHLTLLSLDRREAPPEEH